jgi:pseudouridine synthase
VGRLDADSEGLILLSNDGTLTNLVTHPRHEMTKTYQVLFEGNPGSAAIRRLVEGVELDDGPARAISARIIDRSRNLVLVELVMGEGRNREIRRMGTAIGCPVARLVRVAIGPLSDRSLRPGQWRPLTVDEVSALYRAARRTGGDSPAP